VTLQRVLGHKLRAWRNAQGWSQDIFAEVLGIQRSYLSGVERGKWSVGLGMVERIAERLGVPATALFAE